MKTLIVGIALAVLPWVVFDIIDAAHPHAILFDLGILTILISFIGGIVAVVGWSPCFATSRRRTSRHPTEVAAALSHHAAIRTYPRCNRRKFTAKLRA